MSEPTSDGVASCQACGEAIVRADEAGWECECGVAVCGEKACFDEYFKSVGGGEEVRCRTCGHIT
jgi:hypothetical protein